MTHGNPSYVSVKGACEVLGHDSFIMWSVELQERWTPWSVGKVPKERGEQVGTHSGYVRISTIILGHPHYSSFTSYTPPPCNCPSCHGIASSLRRLYPQRRLPLPCCCPCGHGLLLSQRRFIPIVSSTLFPFNLVIIEDCHCHSVLLFSATPLLLTFTTAAS